MSTHEGQPKTKGRKRGACTKEDSTRATSETRHPVEPETQKSRKHDEEQSTTSCWMQLQQLGEELLTDLMKCEQIVGKTILYHEARIKQVRMENVRLKSKVDLCRMNMEEYSELFEKCVEFETSDKRVRLSDTLKISEQNLEAEKEKRITLEENLRVEKEKTINLEENVRHLKYNLEETKEKQTCQICMEKTRNAVILPCLHFLYCGDCLQNHQKGSSECPTCRGSIGAVLNCKFNLD